MKKNSNVIAMPEAQKEGETYSDYMYRKKKFYLDALKKTDPNGMLIKTSKHENLKIWYDIDELEAAYIISITGEPVKSEAGRNFYLNKTEEIAPHGGLSYIKYSQPNEYTFEEAKEVYENETKYDKDFKHWINAHKGYRNDVIIGTILWMTSCFWLPFIIGVFSGIDTVGIEYCLGNGLAALCLFAYTFPVTIPLTFFFAAFIHPKIIKSLYFEEPDFKSKYFIGNLPANWYDCYSDYAAKLVDFSSSDLEKIQAGILAGTIASEIFSNHN